MASRSGPSRSRSPPSEGKGGRLAGSTGADLPPAGIRSTATAVGAKPPRAGCAGASRRAGAAATVAGGPGDSRRGFAALLRVRGVDRRGEAHAGPAGGTRTQAQAGAPPGTHPVEDRWPILDTGAHIARKHTARIPVGARAESVAARSGCWSEALRV